MNVNTQSINFVADVKLKDFIQKRFEKLNLYYDKIIQADIFLKVENTSDKENKRQISRDQNNSMGRHVQELVKF